MGRSDYLKLGSHNVICERCGRKYKAEEIVREWTGLMVCKRRCYEPRHPQEFLKGKKDNPSVPDSRPDPIEGRCGPSNVVGQAVVGCAIVGWFDKYKSPL